jgi:ArsR family transcriptional regulator
MDAVVEILRAAGEPTRMRILALLARGDLAAGELSSVLGQSQPRVSRHLKLLGEAGLVERRPEGAWVFFRLTDQGPAARIAKACLDELKGEELTSLRDAERLQQIRSQREAQAQAYFEAAADEWETLRRLHQPEAAVESALLEEAGAGPFPLHLDLGSGTGRMLEVFAGRTLRAEGVDSSRKMLALARAKLDDRGDGQVSVRHGDILALPFADASADLVTLHQVLHYLPDPERAIREAARVLSPGGVLLVADFAPHGFEELRERHAHRRLGFAAEEVAQWLTAAGLHASAPRAVTPDSAGPALTVLIWRATRAAATRRSAA